MPYLIHFRSFPALSKNELCRLCRIGFNNKLDSVRDQKQSVIILKYPNLYEVCELQEILIINNFIL